MVAANIAIIRELKTYLEEISKDKEKRKSYTVKSGDFSRERLFSFKRMVSFLINLPKRSLSIEVREFFDGLQEVATCSKSAVSQQRGKLKPLFFQSWNELLINRFYHHYGEKVKRWRGFTVQAVDGSTAYLVNKAEVVEHFGTQDNQYGEIPMARLMQVYDVLNALTVKAGIYPVKTSEQNIMNSWTGFLREGSITLFDRGYPGFALIYLLKKAGRLFVMRSKVSFNREVKRFMKSEETDLLTKFRATGHAMETLREQGYEITAEAEVQIRLAKIKLSSGQTEVLITNLLDKNEFSIDDLSHLYALRWPVETCYGYEKNQLQLEQFSGHRVICIEQDYHASIFTANLQSLIEKQSEGYLNAVSRRRKHRYKINRNVSWAALKNNIVKLFLKENPDRILRYLQQLFEYALEPVREGRKFERKKKAKRVYGKYQTLTNYKRAV
jgi:hypothetical protein